MERPCVQFRMGVFHMTIPFTTPLPRPTLRQQPAIPARPLLHSMPEAILPNPSARTPDRNAVRTPAQQAEQDALVLMVRACLAGDSRAWNALVSGQHKRVYAICYRFTGDPADAEDITQEVFLKVYRNLKSFDAERGAFQTWITTLTRNLLVDNYRRTRLDRISDSLDQSASADPYGDQSGPTMADRLADPRPNQEQHYAGLELKARIQSALAQLSPELREAVILRDLEDMDYKEIALVLKIPEGTVKSRISRGRGELARALERTEEQQARQGNPTERKAH